jgi:3-isopropylmalate/(R)-2-methylmalate dehydratase small subunit
MALEKIVKVTGRCVVVPGDDVDTDRIIPARFMKCVTFDGLGEYFFYDTRFDEKGTPREHPLNDPRFAGATILIGGNNFGCGSSREHAPQSIKRAGFKAILAEGFAEIFFGNSTTLGMPCVVATRADLDQIRALVQANPADEMTMDLEKATVTLGGKTFPCQIRASARGSLLEGRYDMVGELLEGAAEVDRVAAGLPYMRAA